MIAMPSKPGQAEQVHAVEPGLLPVLDLERDRAARERHDHGADDRDQDEHEGVQCIDAVLDAPRRLPAAEVIGDRPGLPAPATASRSR